jgi:hypothetical protein
MSGIKLPTAEEAHSTYAHSEAVMQALVGGFFLGVELVQDYADVIIQRIRDLSFIQQSFKDNRVLYAYPTAPTASPTLPDSPSPAPSPAVYG